MDLRLLVLPRIHANLIVADAKINANTKANTFRTFQWKLRVGDSLFVKVLRYLTTMITIIIIIILLLALLHT